MVGMKGITMIWDKIKFDKSEFTKSQQSLLEGDDYLAINWNSTPIEIADPRFNWEQMYALVSASWKSRPELTKHLLDERIHERVMNRVIDYVCNKGASFKRVKQWNFGDYDEDDGYMIIMSIKARLTDEQIKYILSHKYVWQKQNEIRLGIEKKLTREQVDLYANDSYEWEQMYEIRKGFERGLSMEQVKTYANPSIDVTIMRKEQKKLIAYNKAKVSEPGW